VARPLNTVSNTLHAVEVQRIVLRGQAVNTVSNTLHTVEVQRTVLCGQAVEHGVK
jgi:hypothetical protein